MAEQALNWHVSHRSVEPMDSWMAPPVRAKLCWTARALVYGLLWVPHLGYCKSVSRLTLLKLVHRNLPVAFLKAISPASVHHRSASRQTQSAHQAGLMSIPVEIGAASSSVIGRA